MVDVDPELGLVKVVQVATAQDVGRALNPLSVLGQIEGGIAQGLGLAVMEEIIQIDGRIRNASFTDYLLPTFLDMPDVVATLIEEPDPQAPLGAKGVGEPPCISSTPAIVAAIRDALAPGRRRRQAARPRPRPPAATSALAAELDGSMATPHGRTSHRFTHVRRAGDHDVGDVRRRPPVPWPRWSPTTATSPT